MSDPDLPKRIPRQQPPEYRTHTWSRQSGVITWDTTTISYPLLQRVRNALPRF